VKDKQTITLEVVKVKNEVPTVLFDSGSGRYYVLENAYNRKNRAK
jgi:hypothetical protein